MWKPSTKRAKISPAPPRKSGQTSKQKWPPVFLYYPITSLFFSSPSLPSSCYFPFLQCFCSRGAGNVGEVAQFTALQTLVEGPGVDRRCCKGVPVSVKLHLCSGGGVLVRSWGWGTQDSTSQCLWSSTWSELTGVWDLLSAENTSLFLCCFFLDDRLKQKEVRGAAGGDLPTLKKVFPIPHFYNSERFLHAECLEMDVCGILCWMLDCSARGVCCTQGVTFMF